MMIGDSFRSRLGWKLFLSHLLIVLVGSLVLGVVAYLHAPTAFTHHVLRMQMEIGTDPALETGLRANFLAAIREILSVSGVVAAAAALLVSSFVAWRIVGPIRSLTSASKRIAGGDYRERVEVAGTDEIAQLAQSFNDMASALDATEKRRMELIGDLAHELKTPLTTIRAIMEGLADNVLPADTETFLDVQRETRRLQRLADEMRELSAAEAGAIALELAPAKPGEIVRRSVERLGRQYSDKNVELHVDVPDNLPDVAADHERILQVFINLLGNALQYTAPGGVVTIRARAPSRHIPRVVRFSVADTGIGISPDDITRVFERFYRVEKSRSRASGGSGIGLTIAAHVVRAHGGTIQAESAGLDKGSTFSFTLPVAVTRS